MSLEHDTDRPELSDPVPPQSSRFGGVFWFIVALTSAVCLLVALGFGTAWYIAESKISELPLRAEETADERNEKASAAFSGEARLDGDLRIVEIRRTLDRLQAACRDGDHGAVTAALDGERMFQECQRQGVFQNLSLGRQWREIRELLRQFELDAIDPSDPACFSSYEVCRCDFNPDGDEAVVYVRSVCDAFIVSKTRYWMCLRDGVWRVFDSEDLTVPLRTTDHLVMGIRAQEAGGVDGWNRWVDQCDHLTDGYAALDEMGWESAEPYFQRMRPELVSPQQHARQLVGLAIVELSRGQFKEALKSLDLAERTDPGRPLIDYWRAVIHNAAGDPEEAMPWARQFLKTLGDDAEAYVQLGDALRSVGRLTEAADTYRKGLQGRDVDADCLTGLVLVDEKLTTEELTVALRRLKPQAGAFDTICSDLLSEDQISELQRVVEAYATFVPDDPDIGYYRGQILLSQERFAEAAATVLATIGAVADADERPYFVGLYVRAMVADGKPLEAYRAFSDDSDREHAFEQIADELVNVEDAKTLKELVAARQSDCPDDRWIPYYLSALAALREDWPAVARICRDCLPRADEEIAGLLRYDLTRALFEQNQISQALNEVSPASDTFRQMVRLASTNDDTEKMVSVIDAYRKTGADDPWIEYWSIAVDWKKKEYAKVVQRTPGIQGKFAEDARYAEWSAHSRLVRSLLHLGRKQQAIAEANRYHKEWDDCTLLILVHATIGDVEETRRWIQKHLDNKHSIRSIYYFHTEIADALESDAMKPIREEFPDPRSETRADEDDAARSNDLGLPPEPGTES